MKSYLKYRAVAGLMIIIFLMLIFAPVRTAAGASALDYGIIKSGALLMGKNDGCYFPITTLPENYFAALLGEENENGYIPVSYLDVTGYLKKDAVDAVNYEPKYKYAENNSLTVENDGHPVNVRSSPDHTLDNVIAEAQAGSKLYYYGTCSGTAQVEALGETWYYVKIVSDGETKRGYVYSLYAKAEPIPENVIEKVEPPAVNPDEDLNPGGNAATETPGEKDPDGFTLTNTHEIIIVVSLCLPVILIMYLLFKQPSKKMRDEKSDK